ncbi:unnamed protein product [marine sediment metagenome]|uniref:Uncharacterized protein n=1 Tax=marine sediment metagenome TaxID=412755 RepID=X1S759_9ZZZZ
MHVVGIKQIIERALVSYSGVTTSAGGAGGATLVDSNLSIDYDGQTVLITSGSYTGQARDIDGDTSDGTVTPSSAFGGVIVEGTTFLILSGIPAMAEFDDIKGSGWTNENLTTIDANIDALMAVLGAKDTAAATGAVSGAKLAMAYIKQLVTLLLNATYGLSAIHTDLETVDGIADDIKALVDSAEGDGTPFSYLDAGEEQTVVEDAAVTRRRIWLEFSNRNMTQPGTFRVYRKVDGANYDLYAEQPVLVAAGEERAFDAVFTTNQAWKLTYEEDVDETVARAIPFNVITQVIE